MTTMVFTHQEEDVLASRLKITGLQLSDLIDELESRAVSRNDVFERVKEIERRLRQTRQAV